MFQVSRSIVRCDRTLQSYIFLFILQIFASRPKIRIRAERLTQSFEELLHQLFAFLGQNTASDLGLGVEYPPADGGVAALRVGRAVDHAVDLAPRQSSRAHHARLDGDVQRTPLKILSAERRSRRRDALHLGMGRGVAQSLHQIVAPSHHAVAANGHGADGHLLLIQRLARLVYCHAHEFFIARGFVFTIFHKSPAKIVKRR